VRAGTDRHADYGRGEHLGGGRSPIDGGVTV
jgi:hypothetical protein